MIKEIKEILNNYATDIGVYPAVNNQIPRNIWQDGWNKWELGKVIDDNWNEDFKKGFIEAEKEYYSNLKMYHDWYIGLDTKKEIIDELLLKNKIDLMIIEDKVTMSINSSDLFAWGYADFETIEENDLEGVLIASNNGKWGIEKLLCHKYNMKPQYPIIKRMSEAGEWDETMRNLPDNKYNLQVNWPNEPN